jgi:hypothetical protein
MAMYAYMSYQTDLLTKRLITYSTDIRALTAMYAFMCYQIAPLNEYLITH